MYTIVTNKNPRASLPDWIKEASADILKTKIIWKFKTKMEADEAENFFHDNGFEYVHRTSDS